ncbi:hypothetical protein ABH922_001442 [Rhodococcus sp. 27YEA15]
MIGRAFYDRFESDWRFQLGMLGSGSQFIEVTLDESNGIGLFLHSGSRGHREETRIRFLHHRFEMGAALRAAQPRGDDGSTRERPLTPGYRTHRVPRRFGRALDVHRDQSGRRKSGLSNSSMLTSLNVTTRTYFTNRAGRYMSHTHASDIRSSK